MHFSFLTLFPSLLEGYFKDSILKRAIDERLISLSIINFRQFSLNRHHKVDSPQIGGGAGMVLDSLPLYNALGHIRSLDQNAHIVFVLPVAKPFRSCDAKRLAQQKKHIVFVCGRYEGIDERVIEECADEVFCLGDFVLTGGEIAALAFCDSISRYVDGVLGNEESLKEESFESYLLEPPCFSRQKIDHFLLPPSEYSKGNHARIKALKVRFSEAKTRYYRPDLYQKYLLYQKECK
ncbi:tRNA (guanosine(37)-N1)-methyltransferase TrmD [Helicobacter monodelphidis]|uniref:tRNA (guanosine(37)-N1)-methyltransferase TrmD n=1 Tax=Helicobacter sp. 15-1451 TaxID=2004995 RepID=UPI000DCB37DC|nr:tRNA (guanosine(37)-N1)-methyltransferase TrmD [Helicobacter sp. 15-1451]RAX58448.1 tRNA (guanosine(37)-N1)-methyltransferase TrmD [Helicobacter sp. 15-1451]